jgi:hypothetical protein
MITLTPTVEQLQKQIELYENKYKNAVTNQKNYAVLKRLKEKIKRMRESLQLAVTA